MNSNIGKQVISEVVRYARPLITSVVLVACGGGDSGGGIDRVPDDSSAPSARLELFAGDTGGTGNSDGVGAAARFEDVTGLAVDSNGNSYVVDWNIQTVRKITPAGVVSTIAGLAGTSGGVDGKGAEARFEHPTAVAVDQLGTIYVSDGYMKSDGYGTINSRIRKVTSSGEVSTVVTNTPLSYVLGIAIDSVGNIYVAESSDNAIRKIEPTGVVSPVAGKSGARGSADGVGADARLSGPRGLALDSAGYLYVADFENQTIRKVSPGGVVSTLAGVAGMTGSRDGSGAEARFAGPSGVAVDRTGNVYVADSWNRAVRKITADGIVSTVAGASMTEGSADGPALEAQFGSPSSVALDGAGNLYIGDRYPTNAVRKISAGMVTTLAGAPEKHGSVDGPGGDARFYGPAGLASDSAGNVYVADRANCTIRKITPGGVVSTLAGAPGSGGRNSDGADGTGANARFFDPSGIAIDAAGNLYVADWKAIRKVTPSGTVSTVELGGAFPCLLVYGYGGKVYYSNCVPTGIAVDGAENLYLADTDTGAIFKITAAGNVSILAGAPVVPGSIDALAARFNHPLAIAVDRTGTVYVGDSWNHRIGKVTPQGVVTTLAGSSGSCGSVDGKGSDARFCYPSGLAIDDSGNLYVGDAGSSTIRKVDGSGVVTTVAGVAGVTGFTPGPLPGVLHAPPSLWGIAASGNNLYFTVYNGLAVVRDLR